MTNQSCFQRFKYKMKSNDSKVREIKSTKEFDDLINNSLKIIIVDFTASWCG